MFERTMLAGWGDMDFNSHMRNTAFLDKSADIRMMFCAENGLLADEFHRMRLGPVVMKDELEYFREVRLLETVRVTIAYSGLAEDGSRFRVRNEFWRADGKLAARVTSTGGWLDLAARKLVAPSPAMLAVMRTVDLTDDFEKLPSSIK